RPGPSLTSRGAPVAGRGVVPITYAPGSHYTGTRVNTGTHVLPWRSRGPHGPQFVAKGCAPRFGGRGLTLKDHGRPPCPCGAPVAMKRGRGAGGRPPAPRAAVCSWGRRPVDKEVGVPWCGEG